MSVKGNNYTQEIAHCATKLAICTRRSALHGLIPPESWLEGHLDITHVIRIGLGYWTVGLSHSRAVLYVRLSSK